MLLLWMRQCTTPGATASVRSATSLGSVTE
jgi:hypothetical protein